MSPSNFRPCSALLAPAVALAAMLAGCAGPSPAPRLTEAEQRLQVESFDHIWETVQARHWDPGLNGVDWEAARAELRPKVEAAETAVEARAAMNELLGLLGQTHFGVIPAEAYRELDEAADVQPGAGRPPAAGANPPPSPGGDTRPEPPGGVEAEPAREARGEVGLTVRADGDRVLITAVRPGSPADIAMIRPGFLLTHIDGTDVERLAARVREGLAHQPRHADLLVVEAIEARLKGEPGSVVRLGVLDGRDQRREATISRAASGDRISKLGHLPAMPVRYESRRLEGGIIYVMFNIFLDPPYVMGEFGKTMQESAGARGLILDLRGNPGGLGAISMGIGGWLVSQLNQRLGTMTTRDSRLNFVLNPRPRPFAGPVAVLVDECSASTTEILAGGLQDLKRARIFGRTTAGAALPSVIEKLPNGDGFQYAFANYVSVGGEALEGRGVVPDEVVPYDRAALLAGRDPAIEAASRWILEQPVP